MTTERGGLLDGVGLAKRLGIHIATYHRHRVKGEFKRFEVRVPVGRYRYSAHLVDEYLAGKTVSHYGRRVSA